MQNAPGKNSGSAKKNRAGVLIISPHRFQAELLAMFLRRETGLDCGISVRPDPEPPAPGPEGMAGLVLWDCGNRDPDDIISLFIPRLNAGWKNPYSALFNVSTGRGIESRALASGIRGVFPRETGPCLLVRGINAILNGELWYSRECLARYLETTLPETGLRSENRPSSPLTHRETDVLRRTAAGSSREKIAEELSISPHTVKTHLRNIYKKLGIKSRFEAVRWLAGKL